MVTKNSTSGIKDIDHSQHPPSLITVSGLAIQPTVTDQSLRPLSMSSMSACYIVYYPEILTLIVRLSLLRKTILIPEYKVFMCVCVFVDGCISQL